MAGVAQWIEHQPVNQGHMPGLGARFPVCGGTERQPHVDVSLPLFLPPFLLSKNK